MSLSISKSISKTTLGMVASLVIAGGTSVHAQSVMTESFNINSPLQDLTSGDSFLLPDFKTSLGTLQSVELTLVLTNNSKIDIYNTSSAPETFVNATMDVSGSVTGPGGLALNTTLQSVIASGTAHAGFNGYAVDAATTTTNATSTTSLDVWQDQSGNMVNLSYTKTAPTFGGTDTGGNSDLLFGGNLVGLGEVTVEYTYLTGDSTPPLDTPEPAARWLALIAGSVMASLLFRRRAVTA